MQKPAFLFVTEYDYELRLEDGKEPYSKLSHVFNAFFMAHEALRMGWDVYLKPVNNARTQKISRLYPVLKVEKEFDFSDNDFQPDFIAGVYPFYISDHKPLKNNSKGVLLHSAHYWLESTKHMDPAYIDLLRLALVRDIDFVITQNERMKDIMSSLCGMVAQWHYRERILCAPIGYVPEQVAALGNFDRAAIRQQMGLADDDIAIINSGGPWDWTDIEAFTIAFIKAVRAGATRLKFFQMGLRQKTNLDHERSFQFFKTIMAENADILGRNLIIYDDWEDASSRLPLYNYGADLGINISQDSAENYQSHRVRFTDYVKAELPILNTEGDYLGSYDAHDACLLSKPGNVENYYNILMDLNNGTIDLEILRHKMKTFSARLSSDSVYPPVLEKMEKDGQISVAERRQLIGHQRENYHKYNLIFSELAAQ